MSSASLNRFSGIMLLLGAVVAFIQSFMTLFISDNVDGPASDYGTGFSIIYCLALISSILIVFGLPALFLRQSGERGANLGLVGLSLYAVGIFLGISLAALFISAFPVLAKHAFDMIHVITFGNGSSIAIFPLGSIFLTFIGSILLGVSIYKAKVYPSYVGLFLIIAAVLDVVKIPFDSGAAPAIINLLHGLSILIALGSAGASLASRKTAANMGSAISK